jgi:hypothetical protein
MASHNDRGSNPTGKDNKFENSRGGKAPSNAQHPPAPGAHSPGTPVNHNRTQHTDIQFPSPKKKP